MKTEALVFSNGNLAFFANNEQVPEVQRDAWLPLLIEHIEKCGYDPNECTIRLPGFQIARPFKTDEGKWNWRLEEEHAQQARCQ